MMRRNVLSLKVELGDKTWPRNEKSAKELNKDLMQNEKPPKETNCFS